jgi:hypothetical protein
MNEFDWASLLSAVLGAVVGGAISAVALWLVFRGEESSRLRDEALRERIRHDDRFEDSLAELMRAMGAHAVAVREWATTRRFAPFTRSLSDTSAIPTPPSNGAVITALTIASMLADEDEFVALHPLGSVVAFIAGKDFIHEASTLEAVVALLMLWRRGIITSAKTREDLQTMSEDALERLKNQERASS